MVNTLGNSILFFNDNLKPKFNYDAVPDELKKLTRWVVWKLEPPRVPNGHAIKLPIDPKTGDMASVSDPKTWTTFRKAKAAIHKYKAAGLGFMLGDGYYCLDVDDISKELADYITDPDDRSNPLYKLDHDTNKTYVEISQSGHGLHFIGKEDGKGKPNGSGCRATNYELYDHSRFIAMTGRVYKNLRDSVIKPINDKQMKQLMTDIGLDPEPIKNNQTSAAQPKKADIGNDLTIDELLNKVRAANFRSSIFDGDYSGYLKKDGSPDWSAIDMAVVNKLAFWANRDANKIDLAFRQTPFMRPKWDEKHYSNGMTYGQHTIQVAIDDLGQRGFRGKKKSNDQSSKNNGQSF